MQIVSANAQVVNEVGLVFALVDCETHLSSIEFVLDHTPLYITIYIHKYIYIYMIVYPLCIRRLIVELV